MPKGLDQPAGTALILRLPVAWNLMKRDFISLTIKYKFYHGPQTTTASRHSRCQATSIQKCCSTEVHTGPGVQALGYHSDVLQNTRTRNSSAQNATTFQEDTRKFDDRSWDKRTRIRNRNRNRTWEQSRRIRYRRYTEGKKNEKNMRSARYICMLVIYLVNCSL